LWKQVVDPLRAVACRQVEHGPAQAWRHN
jgi:hypothetical protein